MNAVEIVVFTYRAERHAGWTDATVRDYEMRVAQFFERWVNNANLFMCPRGSSLASTRVINSTS